MAEMATEIYGVLDKQMVKKEKNIYKNLQYIPYYITSGLSDGSREYRYT
jgi:hypothetical protein